jgi:hypothetical protein
MHRVEWSLRASKCGRALMNYKLFVNFQALHHVLDRYIGPRASASASTERITISLNGLAIGPRRACSLRIKLRPFVVGLALKHFKH